MRRFCKKNIITFLIFGYERKTCVIGVSIDIIGIHAVTTFVARQIQSGFHDGGKQVDAPDV